LAPAGWAATKVLWIRDLDGLALFSAVMAFRLLDYYSSVLSDFRGKDQPTSSKKQKM
jgi:hypothetical protein